jgi:hypothetical protein
VARRAIVRDGRHLLAETRNDVAEANARLIAAAPETFKALKELRHIMRGFEHLLAQSEVAQLESRKEADRQNFVVIHLTKLPPWCTLSACRSSNRPKVKA